LGLGEVAQPVQKTATEQRDFIRKIADLFYSPSPKLKLPLFIFKLSEEAAAYNAHVLESWNFDLNKIIQHQHPSQISFGSEFKTIAQLEDLLSDHPLWSRLAQILDQGADFPLEDINSSDREADLSFHSARGNHKSSIVHHDVLKDLIADDVERGFAVPLPLNVLRHLPQASLAPLGCVKQTTLDTNGNQIVKFRMTHDQSFPGPSNLSVNLRVKAEELPPIMYSYTLSRVLHYIVRSFLFIALRLTFGGAPGPALWGVISETITDIGNSLLLNQAWDHHSLFDKISDSLDHPLDLPPNTPFHQARDLSVKIPENDAGKIDIFIDDSIGVAPDIGEAPLRVVRAIPLAIRSISRPLSSEEVIPRKDIISLKKLRAEGQLSESKTILGWLINTRTLTISLPEIKASVWYQEIEAIIEEGRVHYKRLESLLGRLNHIAYILSPMRHFMGRLYKALYRAKARKGWTTLTANELQDLGLHGDFIQLARQGVSLNNITFCKPSVVLRSDACECGMGGYNPATGKAWRWEIPADLRLRTSINSLEFMASVISIWVEIKVNQIKFEDCILSQTDNTLAAGWLRKSNFAEDTDEFIQLTTARQLAALLIDTKSCIYSQWFPGEENSIADSLSRDFHLDASHLASLLVASFPEQAPFGLEILPLPNSIVSWVTSLLLSQPQTEQWSRGPATSKFALGLASGHICGPLESKAMTTWTHSVGAKNTRSLVPSVKASERVDFLLELPSFSSQNRSEPPWIAWHRPSSWQTVPTQD